MAAAPAERAEQAGGVDVAVAPPGAAGAEADDRPERRAEARAGHHEPAPPDPHAGQAEVGGHELAAADGDAAPAAGHPARRGDEPAQALRTGAPRGAARSMPRRWPAR